MTQRIGANPLGRRVTVGSATFLAAGLLLTGCGVGGTEPPPSTPADPKDTLLAAVPNETTPAFRFSGTEVGGASVSGSVDPLLKAMELTFIQTDIETKAGGEFSMTMSLRLIDERAWTKVSVGETAEMNEQLGLPRQWVELDQSKLSSIPEYDGADMGNAALIIRAADEVQQQADGSYTGTVDLTDESEVAEVVMNGDIAALGEQATSLPFTAVIGSDGNLDTLSVDLPAVDEQPAAEYVVKYFDYGNAPAITPPAGDVAPAPDAVYEMLGE
ncbi:hypothetical protein [Salinispora tropica]|uniref:hypothetical protein n=1 Tax=Salinispora tropica TaxID=168695 RepID=UPI00036A9102|nr:hypothetical protein [Salinispora tropica]